MRCPIICAVGSLVGSLMLGCSDEGGGEAPASTPEQACAAEADARLRCQGDYGDSDSRAEHISACLQDACADVDAEAFEQLTRCSADELCEENDGCTETLFAALINDHPERKEALDACLGRVETCLADDADPESVNGLQQDCLGYLTASLSGAAKLDDCVAGSCAEMRSCFAAVSCTPGR